jgi:hypothetical protein
LDRRKRIGPEARSPAFVGRSLDIDESDFENLDVIHSDFSARAFQGCADDAEAANRASRAHDALRGVDFVAGGADLNGLGPGFRGLGVRADFLRSRTGPPDRGDRGFGEDATGNSGVFR